VPCPSGLEEEEEEEEVVVVVEVVVEVVEVVVEEVEVERVGDTTDGFQAHFGSRHGCCRV